MGLFDFLKFGKDKVDTKDSVKSMPTITPDKEIFDCYAIVFKREIANVSGLTPTEKSEVYKLISQSEGGFLNMGAYHSKIYDKYFKGRDWAWIEYEQWNEKFTKLGKFPDSFEKKLGRINTETALGLLSVAELKRLLKSKDIAFTSKAKKQDLIDLAKVVAGVDSEEIIKSKIAEELEKEKHSTYTILMRTINFRGKSLHDYNRAKKVGVKKFEIVQTYESDKKFANMVLKDNPNALPPLYPYDMSWLKPIVEF
jgi:predicted CopG family antitoxin